jgi:hypothetical protein
MPRILLVLIALLSFPSLLWADLPEEHPEWFSWTAQPPAGFVSGRLLPAARAFANPEIGATWLAVLQFLSQQGMASTLIYPNQQQREFLTEWMTTNGLAPEEFTWFEVPTDTLFTGEWSPIPLVDGAGQILAMDAAYYQARRNDDAFAGRWAQQASVPMFRAPLFLANCQWAITSQGLCLVSDKVATTATKLNAAQLRHVLRAWYGCKEVLFLPGPPADGLGCIDAFVRPLASGDLLLGKPASAGLVPTVNTYRKALQAILPEEATLIEVDIPAPVVISGAVWVYLSYLHFVEGPSALLIPAYAGYDSGLTQIRAALADQFPDKAQVVVNFDAFAGLRLWPSRMLGLLPAGDWAPETPSLLCASLDPALCGLCLDECFQGETLCADGLTNQTCEIPGGEGACRVFQDQPCGNQEVCLQGLCQDQPSPCDSIPAGGVCEGEKVKNCVGSSVIYEDCGAKGAFCTYTEGEAHCTAACLNECSEEGALSCAGPGTSLSCELAESGCLALVPTLCSEEQRCLAGACVADAEVVEASEPTEETVAPADEPAEFRKTGGSCSSSPAAPPSPWWLLLAVVLVLRGAKMIRLRPNNAWPRTK